MQTSRQVVSTGKGRFQLKRKGAGQGRAIAVWASSSWKIAASCRECPC